jgi:thiol-disulfide isomerase/thioredoxin
MKRAPLPALALVLIPLLAVAAAPKKIEPATAPSFTLPTSNGTVSLDSLQCKVALVDFWASWCGPCKSSFPWMNAMQERYGPKGLSIVAINVDKSREAADDFLEKHPAPFVVAFDPSGTTAKAFHVGGMPTTFLVGPGRTILLSRAGFNPKHAKEVEAMIQEACAR